MRRWIDFRGLRIDISRQIESVKPQAKESGVDLDKMSDAEAIFYASKAKGQTIPEFLGIEN